MARGTDFGAGRIYADKQHAVSFDSADYMGYQDTVRNPRKSGHTVLGINRRQGYQGSPKRGGNYGPGRGNVGSHGMPGGNFNGPW